MAQLDSLRKQIDALDEKIVALLNERAAAAVQIGKLKRRSGLGVFAPDREQAVLQRIAEMSAGPLSEASLAAIYRELMSASLSLERPPRVGYLGPKGSFSHEAAVSKFGESVDYEPLEDIRAIFSEISRGHVNYGVVPVENTTGGAILDTLDAFIEHETRICCELFRPIHQHLMARCRQDEIAVVYSRPEALRQCRRWLTETGLASRTAPAPSTSRAAEMAAAEVGAAAIGSRLAAKMYGLPILAENIEDHPRNATRFFVLGGDPTPATGNDRTSLMLVTVHRAGALVDVLVSFQRAGVNMTMLTSRPSPSVENEYNFFIDVEGHVDDPSFAAAIEEARRHCRTLVVLGSYPRASEGDSR